MSSLKVKLLAASAVVTAISIVPLFYAVAQEEPSRDVQEEELLQDTVNVEGIRSSIANSIDEKRLPTRLATRFPLTKQTDFQTTILARPLRVFPGYHSSAITIVVTANLFPFAGSTRSIIRFSMTDYAPERRIHSVGPRSMLSLAAA